MNDLRGRSLEGMHSIGGVPSTTSSTCLIDPGKPAQNGTVERSHREDEEKFYQQHSFRSVADLKQKICAWNDYYNNLEHCGLDGETPNEVLCKKVPEVIA